VGKQIVSMRYVVWLRGRIQVLLPASSSHLSAYEERERVFVVALNHWVYDPNQLLLNKKRFPSSLWNKIL